MMVLITYDVSTQTDDGKRRLRKIARACENYGVRVQNSVFECVLDAAQFEKVKNKLVQIMDQEKDSLRFYNLGNNYKNRTIHVGAKQALQVEDMLLF